MTTYSFSGKIQLGREEHPFEREIEAESEKQAEDNLYAELGSEHSINRSKIELEDSEEV
jgi:ribosomal protein L20A (L18A)